ncbi:MAG: ABC transporter permease [Verrucomicrobiota bacterium]|nr:ABC transporter permease [Verrucomicrobiota bacterium]
MLFSPFIAARYLKPKRTFVSIITVISILGVVLAVWMLTVVIAVFTGYGERLKESILGFEPHLTVDAGGFIGDFVPVLEEMQKIEGFTGITPFVSGQVIMDYRGLRSAPTIRGIMPPEGIELDRFESKIAMQKDPASLPGSNETIRRGDFTLPDPYSAVIGDGIADAQGIEVGDTIVLQSPRDVQSFMDKLHNLPNADESQRDRLFNEFREFTAPQEVTVTGIFDSGHWDFDSQFVYIHLETAQVLYGFDLEECHGVAARVDDAFQAHKYSEKLHAVLPQQFRAMTWGERYRGIFNAVATEKQAMYIILFMIMVVGAFCIMNTMITVTVQKRSEIGLLKALGSTEEQIVRIFLLQGLLVGIIGVVVGMALAQWTILERNTIGAWLGDTFGIAIFAEDIYKVDGGIPAKQSLKDLITISVGSFLACTLAALIPALIAASLQPAKALRSE